MRKSIIVQADLCVGCMACFVACKQENLVAPDIQWAQIQRTEDEKKGIITYFRMSCMHCDEPACMPVCPMKAIYKGPKGEVLVDQAKCIGCKMCLQACPWKVPMFNATGRTDYWGDKPPLVTIEKMEHQKRTPGKAERCTLCSHRDTPACVEACKLGVLKLIDLDNLSEDDKKLVASARAMGGKSATKPKVMYVSKNVDFRKIKTEMKVPE